MKKYLIALMALVATATVQAKIIKIAMSDGSHKIYSSSELSEINFNADGTASVVSYDGKALATIDPTIDKITIGDDEEIIKVTERTVSFDISSSARYLAGIEGLDSIPTFYRDVTQMTFAYTSRDPYGDPTTLSGSIIIPQDIMNGEVACDGIILYNHFTNSDNSWAPSNGFIMFESMYIANPLNPRFIFVESDLYGFGLSKRFPQAFIQGNANGYNSLDALLAARRILDKMGMQYGNLLFNIGYSSGGYEALVTQRCRDMYPEYKSQISFTKTFAGGAPSDLNECYKEIVKRDSIALTTMLALVITATNETQRLGLDYNELFQPEFGSRVDELVLSKKYSPFALEAAFGYGRKVHELLGNDYCQLTSISSKMMQNVMQQINFYNGWEPDRTQKIFIMHMKDDDIIPQSTATPLINYLKNHGMRTSIIPGVGNLQTNMDISDMGHVAGVFPFGIQTLASMATWSALYSEDGTMKPEWQTIIAALMAGQTSFLFRGGDYESIIADLSSVMGMGSDEDLQATLMSLIQILQAMGMSDEEISSLFSGTGLSFLQLLFGSDQ